MIRYFKLYELIIIVSSYDKYPLGGKTSMKYCSNCGAAIPDEATFCSYCGAQIQEGYYQSQNNQTTVYDYDNNTNVQNTYNSYPNQYGNQYNYEPPKKKKNKGAVAAIIIVVVLALGVIGGFAQKFAQNSKYRDDYSFSDDELNNEDTTQSKQFEFGKIENNKYSNDFVDLHIDLPSEEWAFLSDEEIADTFLDGASIDPINNKAYAETENEKSYFDTVLYNKNTNENIQVQLMQGLTYNHKNSNAKDMLKSLFVQAEDQFQDLGITVSDKKIFDEERKIGPNTYYSGMLDLKVLSNDMCQLYSMTKIGEDTYVAIIITSSGDSMEVLNYLKMFY